MKENKTLVLFVGTMREIVLFYLADTMWLVLNVLKQWKIVPYVEHRFMILYWFINLK